MCHTDRRGDAVRLCSGTGGGQKTGDMLSPVDLQKALVNNEIEPWYQPVCHAGTGQLAGCEVLARWVRSGEVWVSPEQFIPLAEKSGLIVPLMVHLMQKVSHFLQRVMPVLPDGFHVGVNVSAENLKSVEFCNACLALSDILSARHRVLMAEITESAPLQPSADVLAALTSLREAGGRVALDDFGTGYCTFRYLQQFPVDILKIDRSFTRRYGCDGISDRIVDNIIRLAHELGLDIIAEGTETESQARAMAGKGVQYLQGFLYSPPVPESRFITDWLIPAHVGESPV